MTALQHKLMTVSEFLAWADEKPGRERYELVDGEPVAMAPGQLGHARTKRAAVDALGAAIRRAGLGYFMFLIDGMLVPIDAHSAYEPDALVYCGERLADSALTVPAPVIVVEVVSPSIKSFDASVKLAGYFSLQSVHHYLILDPERRLLIHHARGSGEVIATRVLRGGALALAPPGLILTVEDMFPAWRPRLLPSRNWPLCSTHQPAGGALLGCYPYSTIRK
jgi:Uma2 family endonuclease